MDKEEIKQLDFDKMGGLVPAIVQDCETQKVLMLGFMNEEAVCKTIETGKVTFSVVPKNVYGPKARRAAIFCW